VRVQVWREIGLGGGTGVILAQTCGQSVFKDGRFDAGTSPATMGLIWMDTFIPVSCYCEPYANFFRIAHDRRLLFSSFPR